MSEAVAALQAGTVDALAEDDILGLALAMQNPALAAVGKPFNPRPYAVAIPRGDPDLLAWVSDQLRKAKVDGTYDTLWNRYFGEAGAILRARITGWASRASSAAANRCSVRGPSATGI